MKCTGKQFEVNSPKWRADRWKAEVSERKKRSARAFLRRVPHQFVLRLLLSKNWCTLPSMKGKRRQKAAGIDPQVVGAYNRWGTKPFDKLVKNFMGKIIAAYRKKLVCGGNFY